ncbi:MAG TPA: hypothetical protein VFH13_05665 [Gemmatimonadaceae bacterium]|nr:hypothetical protein [Gemmatimonadaceae bacterium]
MIRLKKDADGRTSLSCTRADGTITWQRHEGAQASFFPGHDLTHYAVENVLGHPRGFYGLVAAGWDLSDFGTPWPRGKLPKDANLVELIVGFFDLDRATGHIGAVEELNTHLATFCEENDLPALEQLTEEDLSRVRRKRGELFAQWEAVEPDGVLELHFDPGALAPSVAD